ncbi:hypothetical protein [Maribacter sp. 1_MG-2023]|uniref:DUF6998 domain-containing protein n=1 Tax=Maribacter sp. 1_MG-2023 TaxID=3062677 RepID=UPI0026E3F944|nr:hypothetical protein [Maribacter sp. 1_MG-2023]MDO6470238.1 hypothetical protein [Maribacter sp. 1_MG-2023]
MKEIQQLLDITASLKKQFEGKLDFSLDGRLVGDIGEALVSEMFDIELYGKNAPVYDGIHRQSKIEVQIKASMGYYFSYPYNIDLEHYIAVHIEPNGTLEVIYNGPGKYINQFLKEGNRKFYRNISTTVTAVNLGILNNKLKKSEQLPQANLTNETL